MIKTLKYHPTNYPIPDGWVLVNDMQCCHHGEYSILIKRIGGKMKKKNEIYIMSDKEFAGLLISLKGIAKEWELAHLAGMRLRIRQLDLIHDLRASWNVHMTGETLRRSERSLARRFNLSYILKCPHCAKKFNKKSKANNVIYCSKQCGINALMEASKKANVENAKERLAIKAMQ